MGPEESCHWWVDSVLLCSANGKKKKMINCTSNFKFVPVLLTPLTRTPFSTFESLKFSALCACGMHTLASADAIWWAICITNHCITVHIDLWGDWKVKHTLIQYCIRQPYD